MDNKPPVRLGISKLYRDATESVGQRLPHLNINPNVISLIGFLFTFATVALIRIYPLNVLTLVFSLVFDWLDGVYARKLNKTSYRGYMIDVTLDHVANILLSLALLYSAIGQIFLFLCIINIILLYVSLAKGKHIMLPLRFIIFVLLLLRIA